MVKNISVIGLLLGLTLVTVVHSETFKLTLADGTVRTGNIDEIDKVIENGLPKLLAKPEVVTYAKTHLEKVVADFPELANVDFEKVTSDEIAGFFQTLVKTYGKEKILEFVKGLLDTAGLKFELIP